MTALLLAALFVTGLPTPARAEVTEVFANSKCGGSYICVWLNCTYDLGLHAHAVGSKWHHLNVRGDCVPGTQVEVAPSGNLNFLLEHNCSTFSVQACKSSYLGSDCGDWIAFVVYPCPPPEFASFCESYANDAVTEATKNKQMKCGLENENADRWTLIREAHLNWCLAQDGVYSEPTTERSYRIAGLKDCAEKQEAMKEKLKQDAMKGKGALTPGPGVGEILKETQPPSPQDKLGIEPGPTIGDFLKETQP